MLLKRMAVMFLILVSGFLALSCESTIGDVDDSFKGSLSKAEEDVLKSSQKFGLKIYKRIVAAQPDSNVFISPLSLSTALCMALNGAASETYTDMHRTLELNDLSLSEVNQSAKSLRDALISLDPKISLALANSVWYREELTFQQNFMNAMVQYYYARIEGCDFADPSTVDKINTWVENNTYGMINKVIDKISRDEIMFLINALYFKGTWQKEFNPQNTISGTFRINNNVTAICSLMLQDETFLYFENDDFQSVDLPYGDGNFSMSVFLPKPGKDLNTIYNQLTEANWENWLTKYNETDLRLFMPKFEVEYEIELKEILSLMGMSRAFSAGGADFTNLFAPGGIFIGMVLHKTAVKVNEEGTEAAAVTVVSYGRSSGNSKPQMMVNHPFLYVIRENSTGTILFIGQMINPTL